MPSSVLHCVTLTIRSVSETPLQGVLLASVLRPVTVLDHVMIRKYFHKSLDLHKVLVVRVSARLVVIVDSMSGVLLWLLLLHAAGRQCSLTTRFFTDARVFRRREPTAKTDVFDLRLGQPPQSVLTRRGK